MKGSLKKFISLCTPGELVQFTLLLCLGIVIALFEVLGVALILPFLELASNPNALSDYPLLQSIYAFLGFESDKQMIIAAAWVALLSVSVSKFMTILSIWYQQSIAWSISHKVSLRLVGSYAELPYLFFLNKEPADLIRSTIDDINNLIEGIVLAGCDLISQLLVILLLFILLFVVNPFVSTTALIAIACIYFLIVLTRKSFLINLGRDSLQTTSDRYRTFVDFISGIKAIKSNGVKRHFINRFEEPSLHYSKIQPLVQITYSAPRYLVETLAFGSVLFVVLYLAKSENGFVDALPTLTLFTLAGYRLIPAINTAYISLARMLNSYPAIGSIFDDIHASTKHASKSSEPIHYSKSIKLSAVSFSYPNTKTPAVDDVSINIEKGMKIALVGPSGSGKSTLADLIMGLLEPSNGHILVDDQPLVREKIDAWQDLIGYVPQDVFLYNESITANIAFGVSTPNMAHVKLAARMAQLSDFIETQLLEQYETRIGDKGLKLSGGQRQRIGLARALYRKPAILVLDEATSALDNVTEGDVVRAIHEEIPNTTIIMIAHRISTVVRCDTLFAIDRGKVVAQGNYEHLMASSDLFRDLARFD